MNFLPCQNKDLNLNLNLNLNLVMVLLLSNFQLPTFQFAHEQLPDTFSDQKCVKSLIHDTGARNIP